MESDTVTKPLSIQAEAAKAAELGSTKSARKELRFTVDRQEMLSGVGITQKILRTWEEAGLFSPELGRGTRRFTANDVARLRFLKHLHYDLGLPKEVMKRLFSRFYWESPGTLSWDEIRQRHQQGLTSLPLDPASRYQLLDLKNVQLLNNNEAFQAIIADTLRKSSPDRPQVLREWLINLFGIVFTDLRWMHYSNPGVYEAARQDLMDRLKLAELAARADTRDGWIVYSPACSDDPAEENGPSAEELERLGKLIPNKDVPF